MVGLGIVHHDVRVRALGDDALAGEHAVQAGGVLRQHAAHGGQTDLPRGDAEGVDQLAPGLYSGQAAGDGSEVVLSRQLLGRGEAAVVGRHRLYLAAADSLPQSLPVRRLADGRRADIFGSL